MVALGGRRPLTGALRVLVLLLVALCTGALLAPAGPAAAAVIPDAITNVVMVDEGREVSQTQSMRLDVTFHVGPGAKNGGSARAGDAFSLQLDPRLQAQTAGFAIYTPDGTAKVADVAIDADGLATFTLASYVETRSSTDGSAFWLATFRDRHITTGDTTLTFTSGTASWQGHVTVVEATGGSGGIVPPFKGGNWTNGVETRGFWNIYLPAGPLDELVVEDDRSSTGGPDWTFDCNAANTRTLAGGTEVSFECTPDHVKWVVHDVPDAATTGKQPTLGMPFAVTDPSNAGDLVVENRASYTTRTSNQESGDELYVYLKRDFGGVGEGATRPVNPTVTQSVCDGGAPTTPKVVPAPNGGGITYSVDGTVEAGGTVQVIGTLSPTYLWTSPMPAGWEVLPDGTASYRIALDEPNCDATTVPAAPVVTQAVCAGPGDVTAPTVVLPADGDGVSYRRSGEVVAGGAVTVTATLGTGYRWGTLPAGWVDAADHRSATFAVALDEIDCTATTVPVTPAVTQAVCAGHGDLTAPSVTPAADADGVTYTTAGDAVAGGTVTVTAALDAGYRWGPLPDGWVDSTGGGAEYRIELQQVTCAPTSSGTTSTTSSASTTTQGSTTDRSTPASGTPATGTSPSPSTGTTTAAATSPLVETSTSADLAADATTVLTPSGSGESTGGADIDDASSSDRLATTGAAGVAPMLGIGLLFVVIGAVLLLGLRRGRATAGVHRAH